MPETEAVIEVDKVGESVLEIEAVKEVDNVGKSDPEGDGVPDDVGNVDTVHF